MDSSSELKISRIKEAISIFVESLVKVDTSITAEQQLNLSGSIYHLVANSQIFLDLERNIKDICRTMDGEFTRELVTVKKQLDNIENQLDNIEKTNYEMSAKMDKLLGANQGLQAPHFIHDLYNPLLGYCKNSFSTSKDWRKNVVKLARGEDISSKEDLTNVEFVSTKLNCARSLAACVILQNQKRNGEVHQKPYAKKDFSEALRSAGFSSIDDIPFELVDIITAFEAQFNNLKRDPSLAEFLK
eukprot:NODE_316_length_11188_cov_0.303905.p5 type:complete len:244 gc:universal NODE_316_length_11188_cov_0.303905:126-857(+)